MWKSVPALVQLRKDVCRFLDEVLEPGGEHDYVTAKHLMMLYVQKHRPQHHPDQIHDAISENVPGRLVWGVLISEGGPDEDICMGCGNPWKHGYKKAFQGVKMRSGMPQCPYDYGCDCLC